MSVTEGLIDSHAHLVHEDFAGDRPEMIMRARAQNVRGFIVPATDVDSSRRIIELAASEKDVYAAVGIHPHDVGKAGTTDLSVIRSLAQDHPVVAIGEIGLDYYYDFTPPDLQKEFFRQQLTIASDLDLPVIVHTRESMDDAIALVQEHVDRSPSWCADDRGGRRGVFHCFTGTEDQARALFALGFFVSFPGILTFKKSPVVGLFSALAMERVLVETDAPYMAPVPVRGKRNEPAYMVHTAQKMAELSGRTLEEITQITRAATIHLFQLG